MTEVETSTPAYPRHWEADVLLRDGGSAHLRPASPSDAELLVAFYEQVSSQSKYYRFFAAMPTLSEREVERFLEVDHHDRVALVLTVAEQMIAIGQFERLEGKVGQGDLAEVAFLVQDRHHHRGIGQLLLEHLAQVGREVGVEKFVAEVLPDNIGMLQVFREAGYQVAGGFDEGVMHMEFSIDPTTTSLEVMQAREHRAETASVQRFFSARSVAVIGASRRNDTVGRLLVRNLVLGDYQGRAFVVNPAADAVKGMPAYDSVTDVPGPVDVAIVAVPAEAVPDVVLDCAHKGVHGLVVVSSGFAETGEEGRQLQRQVLRLCRTYGLRLIGPNALGIINTSTDFALNASLSPVMPPRGRAGFFCQSGALGIAILENVSRRGLGLSTFVSAGNRADVSGNDLLQYWEEDDSTEVVLLFLESIGNPRKFSRIARRVSRRKPVIAVKSGRTTQGVPMGHSVRTSEAGQAAVDAMFRQAGVIQVDTLDEMFDVAQLVAHQPLPRGNRLAIVGNSDALALIAADAAAAAGLEVRSAGTGLRPDASAEDFEHALDAAIDDPEVDAVLAVFIPPVNTTGTEVANVLAVVGEQSDKPVVSTFLAAQGLPELLRVPDVAGSTAGRGSVPSYGSPALAVQALARAAEYAAWLNRPEPEIVAPAEADRTRARTVVNRVLAESPDGRRLSDEELTELLGAYGVEVWERAPVATEKEAVAAGERLGWDVILKATADHLRQRPDLAHVWRNIDTEEEMRDAWQTMTSLIDSRSTAGFVVQRHAPAGVPVRIHGVEDPLFGPVVSFGVSGAATELLGDRAYRIPPMHALDAAEMVRDIKAAPLLFGYRGSAPVDTDSVERLLLQVAQLKNDLPQVRDLDLSLVIVGLQGTTVLTGSARVEPAVDARSDWYARRMASEAGESFPG
ncbi:MAG TPA: GNAT family N-acetyltransferase [Marmoricola sp.]|nr:GNAT family N-acetyltransferase [Marmoricola sp.]